MKRAFVLVLLCVSLMFCGCTSGENGNTSTAESEFSPILRISVEDGAAASARLFYLPLSQGVLYLHPDGEGFSAGFVSTHRSISAEKILKGEGSVAAVTVSEEAKDRIFLAAETGVYTLIMDGKTADSSFTAYPEKGKAERYGFFDELTLYGEAEELLLLLPVNLSETYVLAQKKLLTDLDSVLTATADGRRIWYTRSSGGENLGIAFFEYGKNTPLGTENFSFDGATAIAPGKVLFTRSLEDGGSLYIFRDLESAVAKSVTTDSAYDAVSVTPDGTRLAALKRGEGKGSLDVFSLDQGEKLLSLEIPFGEPQALALSHDGGKVFLAVGSGTDIILGSVDL